jgi:hypothetical protein
MDSIDIVHKMIINQAAIPDLDQYSHDFRCLIGIIEEAIIEEAINRTGDTSDNCSRFL